MTVTPIYASVLALVFLILSTNVIAIRRSRKISLGDGDDALLRRRIRAQANFAEYVPLALILIVMVEERGAHGGLVHGLAAALLVGRAMHGFALSTLTKRPFHRTVGMVVTLAVIGIALIACLVQATGLSLGG